MIISRIYILCVFFFPAYISIFYGFMFGISSVTFVQYLFIFCIYHNLFNTWLFQFLFWASLWMRLYYVIFFSSSEVCDSLWIFGNIVHSPCKFQLCYDSIFNLRVGSFFHLVVFSFSILSLFLLYFFFPCSFVALVGPLLFIFYF